MPDLHKNFAYSTILTAPVPATSGTSLVVASGDGTKFPTVPFNCTVWPISSQPSTTNAEVIRVTAIATDTFTIVRAQEASTARSVIVGDQIAATITAKTLNDVETQQTEVDFGTTPVAQTIFTISDTNVAANSKIIAQVAYDAPTGKDLDEIEMDTLEIRCGNVVVGTSFDMLITSSDGSYLEGTFKINYKIN